MLCPFVFVYFHIVSDLAPNRRQTLSFRFFPCFLLILRFHWLCLVRLFLALTCTNLMIRSCLSPIFINILCFLCFCCAFYHSIHLTLIAAHCIWINFFFCFARNRLQRFSSFTLIFFVLRFVTMTFKANPPTRLFINTQIWHVYCIPYIQV